MPAPVLAGVSPGSAPPSSVHGTEQIVFFVLLQLLCILVAARLFGQAARWIRQPRVVGEILAGLLLGPSLFGQFFPRSFGYVFLSAPVEPMAVLSQIGLVLLMFQIGLEFDFSHLAELRNSRSVILVSGIGIALPFVLGSILGRLSHASLAAHIPPPGYILFMATAMSITAIPVLGRIMIELDLTRTRLGAIAISAAAVDDVSGWTLLAMISAIATSQFSAAATLAQIVSLIAYLAFCWWVARPLLHRMVHAMAPTSSRLPANLLAVILGAVFLSALATYRLGVFAIFGGFTMGVLLYDAPDFVAAWKSKVGEFVNIFFLPIFFTYTGLRTHLQGLSSPALWGWAAAVLAVATVGKFGGCYAAARLTGLAGPEAACLGMMMNTRGLMELVVVNVGYDLGLIPPDVFTMLVMMALVSTLITTPLLRLWLPRVAPSATLPAS